MKAFRAFLEIAAMSISLASIIFMVNVFWHEAILGQGVLYIEPNRNIALAELLICAFGVGAVIGSFIRKMRV